MAISNQTADLIHHTISETAVPKMLDLRRCWIQEWIGSADRFC